MKFEGFRVPSKIGFVIRGFSWVFEGLCEPCVEEEFRNGVIQRLSHTQYQRGAMSWLTFHPALEGLKSMLQLIYF